ncbi:MAG: replicative DNA helicase [Thermodesulfobacteriota bacterium]
MESRAEQASSAVLRRVPPNSADAEQAALGAVFVRPAMLDDIAAIVRPEDFYSVAHQAIFRAMVDLGEAGKRVDLVTVADALTAAGKLDAAGGHVYLAEVASGTVAASNGVHHARIVRDMAARRKLIELGCSIVEEGFDLTSDVEACGRFTQEIDAAIHGTLPEGATVTPSDYLPGYMEELARLQEAGGLAGIPSPWENLNRFTAGFVPGEITILAGRSGTGKTAAALNIAEYAARLGHTVGVLSLEMTRHALTNRFMAAGAEVDAQRFRNASLSRDDWQKLYDYAGTFHHLPILICDKREIRPSELRSMCRKWKRERGLAMLIVDYLQLMKPEARDKNREREVSEISRALKLLAVDLEIPILVLAQLNREAEKEKRPRLGHLRESGAIEQDADIILFIVPWKNSENTAETVDITIDVAKGRNNAVGDAHLIYRRRFLRFENRATEYTIRQAQEHEGHWQERQ